MATLEQRILHKAEEVLQDIKLCEILSHNALEGKTCKQRATFIQHQYLSTYSLETTKPFNNEKWRVG